MTRPGAQLPLGWWLAGLAAGALVLGLLALWWLERPSESAAIARVAGSYAEATGNPRTDCIARPAEVPRLWLYVVCKPSSGQGSPVVFLLDHRGRQVRAPSLEAIVARGS